MNIPYKNQQQMEFEVFPKEDKTNYAYLAGIRNDPSTEPAAINIVFSYQSVIVIFICAIMLLVASFVLGVEKGKLIAKNNTPAELPLATTAALSQASMPTGERQKTAVPASPARTPAASSQKEIAAPVISSQPITAASKEETTQKPGYTIQIASLKSENAAKGLSETLIKKGLAAFTKSSGKYIVVLAGNFGKKEEAQDSLKVLKKTYSDCFIKKI